LRRAIAGATWLALATARVPRRLGRSALPPRFRAGPDRKLVAPARRRQPAGRRRPAARRQAPPPCISSKLLASCVRGTLQSAFPVTLAPGGGTMGLASCPTSALPTEAPPLAVREEPAPRQADARPGHAPPVSHLTAGAPRLLDQVRAAARASRQPRQAPRAPAGGSDPAGGGGGARPASRRRVDPGLAALWRGTAAARVLPAAREGRGFRTTRDHGARRQGRQGPRRHAPGTRGGPLAAHLERVHGQHESDLEAGAGSLEVPAALERKDPRAAWEWGWPWVFPATRHHADSAQELLGDRDVSTTMIHTHVLNRCGRGVHGPLDGFA